MYNRIISLAPSNTEILFALGVNEKVVGVTSFCDFPAEATKLPKIGSWIYARDLKRFEDLNPDLLITSMYIPPSVKEWADNSGVKLVHLFPQTIEEVFDSFVSIGRLVDKETESKKLRDETKRKLSLLKSMNQNIKIYSEEFNKPPTVAANWVPDLIRAAGGIPFSKSGVLSYEIQGREVEEFDPDLIVLHWCGFGLRQNPQEVLSRKEWQNINAVKKNVIVTIDDTFLNRPSPRIWRGAYLLNNVLHAIQQ